MAFSLYNAKTNYSFCEYIIVTVFAIRNMLDFGNYENCNQSNMDWIILQWLQFSAICKTPKNKEFLQKDFTHQILSHSHEPIIMRSVISLRGYRTGKVNWVV